MRILFAIDIREPELDHRLEAAIAWARQLGCTLDLLYVTPDIPNSAYLGIDYRMPESEANAIHERERTKLEGLQGAIPAAHRGEIALIRGPKTGEAIAEAAVGYELLLLHTHGRAGLSHFFMGSIAERVVRVASVPTLILRVPE